MTSGLVRVRGAELIDGRLIFGPIPVPGARVSVFARVWRQCFGPAQIEVFPGERFVLATRTHWCVPLKQIAPSGAVWPAAMMVSWLLDITAGGFWVFKLVVWVGAIAHQAMVCHKVLAWRAHLLVVTSQRMVQVNGVFTSKVDSRQLARITDFEVYQSFWGRRFGFGRLRIESAGRHDDGAKRELIDFVPAPMDVYRAAHLSASDAQWLKESA